MLELRESDVPILIVFFVVFPVVVYILIGKWSDNTNRKEKVSFLAEMAVEESRQAEVMSAIINDTAPPSSPLKTLTHRCALCFRPSTTRCSRCKSVRYCSGKCQIIHWRQGHKQECQQIENSCSSHHSASKLTSTETVVMSNPQEASPQLHNPEKHVDQSFVKNSVHFATTSESVGTHADSHEEAIHEATMGSDIPRKPTHESNMHGEFMRNKLLQVGTDSAFEGKPLKGHGMGVCSTSNKLKKGCIENKLRSDESMITGEFSKENCQRSCATVNPRFACSTKKTRRCRSSSCAGEWGFMDGHALSSDRITPNSGTGDHIGAPDTPRVKMNTKSRGPNFERTAASIITQIIDGIPSMGNGKVGLKRSKVLGDVHPEVNMGDEKIKALFPYEEFVKFFRWEVSDLSPRGLLNYRNSCYANAVLQCITCTKPLVIYLLQRSHSRICRMKKWCLMCELEQHVMLLKECGGPISPTKILYHMHKLNRQIGDGNQEDAHEFLRLLVACMQSTCLDGVGGEYSVNPKLQETTFIQHTFGGRLRSKVKCMRCQQESETYENILDLTLEIPSWVESLEDALTQFTTPEALDGDNMYRCRRCSSYVRALKQFSIHQAPNIFTFVLKRFQEGKYGKINKCIAFPDMLDVVPYMTGAGDVPPPYALYAVVVHLDTLNASFSGHYVAYVKDFKGSWLRIDDIQVQPVMLSQVMSQGAYILFYTRTEPRPSRGSNGRARVRDPTPGPAKNVDWKTSFRGTRRNGQAGLLSSAGGTGHGSGRVGPGHPEDATYSDWSHFTSSDEASFSTESTRDSFSTVDCGEADPPRGPAHCRMYSDRAPWFDRRGGRGYHSGCP